MTNTTATIIVKAPTHEVKAALAAPGLRSLTKGILPNINFATTDVITETDDLGRRLLCAALKENGMEYRLFS